MSFFTIQGVHAIPVAHEKADVHRELIGDVKRSYSGKMLGTNRAIKNKWQFTTTWLVELEWRFLRAILEGEGHHWSFDDSSDYKYSSKGLGPTSVTYIARYTGSTKFSSAGALQVTLAQYVQYNVGYTNEWTVMVWRLESGTWHHYIVNNSSEKWVDGVRNDAASTPFITMVSGNIRIGDTGSGATQYFEDLVVIPEKINASWAVDLGVMTAAFSDLPLVRVGGNLFLSKTHYVRGFDVDVKLTQGFSGGSWQSNLGQLSATLIEDSRV